MFSLPMEIIQVPTMVPSPVSVMVPITMPTTAQARPTGKRLARTVRHGLDAGLKRRASPAGEGVPEGQGRHDENDERHGRGERIGRDQGKPDPEGDAQSRVPQTGRDGGAEDERHGERQADRAGEERRVAGKEQIDEHAERRDEEPVLLQLGPGVRQFALRQAAQVALAGFQMHREIAGREIEDCRE